MPELKKKINTREHIVNIEFDNHKLRADLSHALEANALLIAENRRLRELLQRAMEELRLIRMKDCSNVYDVTLRIEASAALAKHGSQS